MVCGGRDPLAPASGWPGAGAGTAATAARDHEVLRV